MANIGKVYLQLGNSGATFSVDDEGYGPTLNVSTSSFGNLVNEQKIYTDLKSLEALKALLEKALLHDGWSKGYVHSADVSDEDYENIISDVMRKKIN